MNGLKPYPEQKESTDLKGTQEPVNQVVPFLIFPNDKQDNHVDRWIFNRDKSGQMQEDLGSSVVFI